MNVIFCCCPKLKSLVVELGPDVADISGMVGQCPELQELWISNSPAALTDISEIGRKCPQLTSLGICGGGYWPGYQGHSGFLSSDAHLVFPIERFCDVNQLVGINVTDINEIGRSCSMLTFLNMAGCDKVRDITVVASSCPKLKSLNLHGCNKLTNASTSAIGRGCPELQKLDIAGVQCTDLSEIACGCRDLTSLNIR